MLGWALQTVHRTFCLSFAPFEIFEHVLSLVKTNFILYKSLEPILKLVLKSSKIPANANQIQVAHGVSKDAMTATPDMVDIADTGQLSSSEAIQIWVFCYICYIVAVLSWRSWNWQSAVHPITLDIDLWRIILDFAVRQFWPLVKTKQPFPAVRSPRRRSRSEKLSGDGVGMDWSCGAIVILKAYYCYKWWATGCY